MSTDPVAAQQSAASAASTAGNASNTALTSLSSNFGNFLGLLMTQLQNQDPTSPLDTNQFTSELVQFSSVEQQINTNSSLTQLIQLTQAGEIMQSSAMVGKTVAVQSADLTLQSGHAALNYTSPATEPVAISVTSDTGAKILDTSVTAARGTNTWTWDGTDASGNALPDGTYKVTVTGTGTDGSSTALPFTVSGIATGVQNQNNTLTLLLGSLSVPFSAVAAVGN